VSSTMGVMGIKERGPGPVVANQRSKPLPWNFRHFLPGILCFSCSCKSWSLSPLCMLSPEAPARERAGQAAGQG